MARACKLEQELAGIAEMSPAQLREWWEKLGEGDTPNIPPSVLRHLLAQRIQERKHGRLPLRVSRELERIAQEGSNAAPPPRHVVLTPGTRLLREWNGKTICVDVLDEGFAYDNRIWRSLSEIARHVTGAHWSGPRFFGLKANG